MREELFLSVVRCGFPKDRERGLVKRLVEVDCVERKGN